MDKVGIALGVCNNQIVLGTSSTRRTIIRRPENREWVSIIEYISSYGEKLRPLVIFKGKVIQNTWYPKEQVPN